MTDVRRRRQILAAVLAVALVLLVFLSYRASADRYDPDGQAIAGGERNAVLARAKMLATQAMSYDSASATADVAKAEQNMTPEMRAEYERTLPSPSDQRKQASTGAKVVATVVRAGLISVTEDEASVLVFVNQQASAKSTKKILESPTWEIIQLVRSGGEWLLSGMESP
jgi:Mce-associated membrane protein